MIPWEQLGVASIPGGEAELRLMRRGGEFSIMSGPTELMNSRSSGSEQALASLACGRLQHRPQIQILIGGLGMGFTLRAALEALAADARVAVAELVPAVVEWGRGPLATIFGSSLADRRVNICIADVGELIGASVAAYDAILLDVDNGPGGLARAGNDRLYGAAGLKAASRALRPAGILAVWSSAPDQAFATRLRRAGFAVEEIPVRARGRRGTRQIIWLATKPGVAPS